MEPEITVRRTYAIILYRIAAYLIDYAILVPALLLPQGILYIITDGFPFTLLMTGPQMEIWILLTISLPAWLYFALSEWSHHQATIGKRLLHLYVTDISGRKITLKQAVVRTMVKILPWELSHLTLMLPTPFWNVPTFGFRPGILIVYLLIALYISVMFFNRRRQSMDDIIARSMVIRAR